MIDVELNLVGNCGGEALDLDLVNEMLDDAPLPHARCLPAKLDLHGDFNPLVGRDAGKVDMQHAGAEGVPLQVADEQRLRSRPL